MNNVTIRPVTAMFANTARPRPDRPFRPYVRRSGFAVFVDDEAIRCFRTRAEAEAFLFGYPEHAVALPPANPFTFDVGV